MKGARLLRRLRIALRREDYQTSYAQCGEDIILRFLFDLLEIPHPTYLDIGAHHATCLSNTYLFYRTGSRGVCVEPDPVLLKAFKLKRPGDRCLNIGISAGASEKLLFYIFNDPTLNTFAEKVRDEQIRAGRKLEKTLEVSVLPINEVLQNYFTSCPNFISLDTEGMDLAILQKCDFAQFRPEAFCIETLTNLSERKMTEIIEFMAAKDYTIYGDTYINTIFVDRHRWFLRLANRSNHAASDLQ